MNPDWESIDRVMCEPCVPVGLAACLVGVCRQRVYQWIARGQVRTVSVFGCRLVSLKGLWALAIVHDHKRARGRKFSGGVPSCDGSARPVGGTVERKAIRDTARDRA